MSVVFDIETGPLSEEDLRKLYIEPTWEEFSVSCDQRWKEDTKKAKFEEAKVGGWAKFVDKAALDWATGRVVAIGYKEGSESVVILGTGAEPPFRATEAEMLNEFWCSCQDWIDEKQPIIGHNIFFFDLPFLTMRSVVNGVEVPPDVVTMGGRFPAWHRLFIDTMQVVGFGKSGSQAFTKLDKLGKFFGLGGKTEGVSGGDFHKLWFGSPEDHARAIEYLTRDVELTAAVVGCLGAMRITAVATAGTGWKARADQREVAVEGSGGGEFADI